MDKFKNYSKITIVILLSLGIYQIVALLLAIFFG